MFNREGLPFYFLLGLSLITCSTLHAGAPAVSRPPQPLRPEMRPSGPSTTIDCYTIAQNLRREFESRQRESAGVRETNARTRTLAAEYVDGRPTPISAAYEALINEYTNNLPWAANNGFAEFDSTPGQMRRVANSPQFFEIIPRNGPRVRYEILSCDLTPNLKLREINDEHTPEFESFEYRRAGTASFRIETFTNFILELNAENSPHLHQCHPNHDVFRNPEHHWVRWQTFINFNNEPTPPVAASIMERRRRFPQSIEAWAQQQCEQIYIPAAPAAPVENPFDLGNMAQ